MEQVSSSSLRLSGGSMVGSREAISGLPVPGGPLNSRLWLPAAAISSARRAVACPIMSAKSPMSSLQLASVSESASCRSGVNWPCNKAADSPRLRTASSPFSEKLWISRALALGNTSCRCWCSHWIAAGRQAFMPLSSPVRPSSPINSRSRSLAPLI
jgi:hypothetical protein